MNDYEDVCNDCPLRTRVDVARAGARFLFGSQGVRMSLHDGGNRYTLSAYDDTGEAYDPATLERVRAERIKECDSPQTTLLRKKCGAGLASAWRWSKNVEREMSPTIQSAEDVYPLLVNATMRDVGPYELEPVMILGSDVDRYSDLWNTSGSGFHNVGFMKLADVVRGTRAALPKGKAIMLDQLNWGSNEEHSYRLRVAQNGPTFAFQSDTTHQLLPLDSDSETKLGSEAEIMMWRRVLDNGRLTDEETKRVLADGLYAYLYADKAALEASEIVLAAARQEEEKARHRSDWINPHIG